MYCKEKKRQQRGMWSKKWLLERNQFSHMVLLSKLASRNPKDFNVVLQMNERRLSKRCSGLYHSVHKKKIQGWDSQVFPKSVSLRRPDRVRRPARSRPYTTQHVRTRMGAYTWTRLNMHFSNHTCIPIFLLTLFVGLQLQCKYSRQSHVFTVLMYD